MELYRYRTKALGALAVKSLPLIYGGTVILLVNTHLPRDSELGVYSLALATFFIVSLLGKSFALFPLIKFLSEGREGTEFWSAGSWYWLLSQAVGALFLWAIAPWTPSLFHAPGLDQGIRWAAGIVLVFIPRDLASAWLQSQRALGRLFLLEASYFIIAAGGITVLAAAGTLHSAEQVLVLNLIGGGVSTLLAPLLCRRVPAWKRPTGETWRKTAKYGRDSLGIGVGDLAYNQLDYHLLGLFLGAGEVALYFAAKNFFRFYNAITQAINLLIFPTSSNLFARGEIGKLKELIEKVLGGYLGGLLLLNLIVLIAADHIVAVVYRGLFPDAANVLRWFAIASFFEPLYMVSENVLYGIGKPRAILVAMWSSIAVFLILSLILMPLFGAQGGALTVLGTLISLSGITLYYLRRELQVTPLTIAGRVLGVGKAWLRKF